MLHSTNAQLFFLLVALLVGCSPCGQCFCFAQEKLLRIQRVSVLSFCHLNNIYSLDKRGATCFRTAFAYICCICKNWLQEQAERADQLEDQMEAGGAGTKCKAGDQIAEIATVRAQLEVPCLVLTAVPATVMQLYMPVAKPRLFW